MAQPELTDSIIGDGVEIAEFLALPDPGFFEYEYQAYQRDHAVFIQARQDGRLVGTQALMPYPLVVGGRIMLSGRSERTKVDASQRGGGLFPELMRTCGARGEQKGLQFIWGTTILKSVFQRVGFAFFDGFYERALLCVNPAAAPADLRMEQRKSLRAAKAVTAAPSLLARIVSLTAAGGRLEFRSEPRDAMDVFKLFERLRAGGPLVVMHHEERLLHWLFDESGRTIKRYYAYRGADLVAYAYVDVSNGTTCDMIDFGAQDIASLRRLVHRVVRDLSAGGAAFLQVTYNSTNPILRRLRTGLMLAGFVPFYRKGGFVTKPLGYNDLNYLNDLSRWYITGMWFQLYPGS
jgi:hypothetical protein